MYSSYYIEYVLWKPTDKIGTGVLYYIGSGLLVYFILCVLLLNFLCGIFMVTKLGSLPSGSLLRISHQIGGGLSKNIPEKLVGYMVDSTVTG